MTNIIQKIISFIIALIMSFSGVPLSASLNFEMPDAEPGEYGQWVDPFIGTGGIPWTCAMLSPAATVPFGNVRLGPDTCFAGGAYLFKMNTSGYYYQQHYIKGFSHGRLSGTGVEDLGTFRVTPRIGKVNPAARKNQPLYYSHSQETAVPGYYAVYLPTEACLAEMTATAHVGAHRYTFYSDSEAHLLIDANSFIGNRDSIDGVISVDTENGVISGQAMCKTEFCGRYGGLPVYFYAVCDTPITGVSVWNGKEVYDGETEASGDDVGADLRFGSIKGGTVGLRVGVSSVSIENAKLNLEAEADSSSFDEIKKAASDLWEERLSAIKLTSADDEVKKIFYTSLYHTMIMPTDFTDANGEYLGFDKKVGIADGFTYRTDMSLWDTCRNTHSLYDLIAQDVQLDCLRSLVLMAEAGGTLPRWPAGAGYSGSMFGTPADIVISESYQKGITDFDIETAYEYMKKTSDGEYPGVDSRSGLNAYNTLGYCALDDIDKSVSRTLEYAWEDAAIATLANVLGKEDEAEKYAAKSKNYLNLFDPDTKYFRAKNLDGSWGPLVPDFTTFYDEVLIKKVSKGYAEGSARQWRWSVIHDIPGLIGLFGSKEYFVSELEDFMEDASLNRAGLNPGAGYWLGNQHDIHTPYLFNDASRPDLTQKWVRWSLSERFSTDNNGLDGNDDGGTLSAWYVFSSLGFYPLAGSTEYWIGSPCVERAEMTLSGGGKLIIRAENQSEDNIYIQSVTLNGKKLTSPRIDHSQIANGGELVFVMGSSPAANGGF